MKKLNSIPAIPRSHQYIWWFCRAGLFIWGCVMMCMGNTVEFLEAIFAIIFTHLWDMFQLFGGKSFITLLPYKIFTYLNSFIFFGVAIGSTINMYSTFEHIDIPEHFFAGFLAAVGGYEFAVIIQSKQPKDKKISPALAAIFSFAFSVSIMVGWEFYEFTMDRLYGLYLQRASFNSDAGLIDTMADLIIGSSGSLAGMFVNIFTNRKRNKKQKLSGE